MIAKRKILFVDDEKRVLNSMRGMFRRDYELFLTTEGAEAVDIAANNEIDVIVADQRMPGMTGVEVLEKVRNASPRTVRILLTGYADPAAIQGSINVGEVFRFLSKPCPPKLLRETLQLAIDAAQVQMDDLLVPELPIGDSFSPDRAQNADRYTSSTTGPLPVLQPDEDYTSSSAEFDLADDDLEAVEEPRFEDSNAVSGLQTEQPSAAEDRGDLSVSNESDLDADDTASTLDDPDYADDHWQTRTDVIMTGDTSQEVTHLNVSRRIRMNAGAVGVVIFTANRAFADTVHQTVVDDRTTTVASSLSQVVEILEQRQAGVLITDATADINLLQRMIGALKQHLPELVSIVVSDSRDATDMINLINYGQVYRYIVKPVDALTLRTDVNAAVLKHLQLLNHPELIQRHQVIELSQNADASSPTLNRFIGKVTRLRELWTGSGAKSH